MGLNQTLTLNRWANLKKGEIGTKKRDKTIILLEQTILLWLKTALDILPAAEAIIADRRRNIQVIALNQS